MDDLDFLFQSGVLEPIDLALARQLPLTLPHTPPHPLLILAIALVSRAIRQGHAYLDLRQTRIVLQNGEIFGLPYFEDWRTILVTHPLVGRPDDWKPLILEGHALYLFRYWQYEKQLAVDFAQKLRQTPLIDYNRLRVGLDRLFADDPSGSQGQRQAAAVAILSQLAVITGGPGTGKTTTLVKILALLRDQQPDLTIALAAPTGKAAARMAEAIQQGKQSLLHRGQNIAQLPEETQTLHRLLGALPDGVYFRHNRTHPLGVDVLVIDETSMVDMALMAKTVAALRPSARLILLGDSEQLYAVEAGEVLAALANPGAGVTAEQAARLNALGCVSPPIRPEATALHDSVARLTHSYRFAGGGAIGRLATAVQQGDVHGVERLLDDPPEGLAWVNNEDFEGMLRALTSGYEAYWAQVAAGAEPHVLFRALQQFRVLCPQRQGAQGVEAIHARYEHRLQGGKPDSADRFYRGRAVMMTRNDYGLQLYNGDLGIAWPATPERTDLRLFIPQTSGDFRQVSLNRLPHFEPAYAMTVHKSQGSEFEHLLLWLPPQAAPFITRELLYTAITRAKSRITLWGSRETLINALTRVQNRLSGLRQKLLNQLTA